MAHTRDERKQVAALIMEKLDILSDYTKAFVEKDQIGCSEFFGYVYWANEAQQRVIAEMEKEGQTVFAVLHGTYILGGIDKGQMTSYLFVDNEIVAIFNKNKGDGVDPLLGILDEKKDGTYSVLANVTGFCDEIGYIGVRGLNGGLERIW